MYTFKRLNTISFLTKFNFNLLAFDHLIIFSSLSSISQCNHVGKIHVIYKNIVCKKLTVRSILRILFVES